MVGEFGGGKTSPARVGRKTELRRQVRVREWRKEMWVRVAKQRI